MKNFLLGIGVCFCFGVQSTLAERAAAIKTEILTVKPATPKSVVVIECSWGNLSNSKKEILNYSKSGYIVSKTVSVDAFALVVMEKY